MGDDSQTTLPWERQKRESSKAYAAFCHYRDTPPQQRSVRKCCATYLGEGYTSKLRQWQRWCSEKNWVERVKAWEDEQQRYVRAAQLETIKKMQERQAKEAQALQGKALQRLSGMEPTELSPALVLRYFIEAAKFERIAMGQPSEVSSASTAALNIDVGKLTLEQLQRIANGESPVAVLATPGESGA